MTIPITHDIFQVPADSMTCKFPTSQAEFDILAADADALADSTIFPEPKRRPPEGPGPARDAQGNGDLK